MPVRIYTKQGGMVGLKIYKKIMDALAGFEKLILIVSTVGVTTLTFINVCVRKLVSWMLSRGIQTDLSFAWSEEIVINVFVLLIMCGCALAAREGGLISLSLIFDSVNKTGKKIMTILVTVANSIFYLLILKTGMDKVMTQLANGKRTSILLIPEWIFYLALPIGAILLMIHTIEFLIDVLTENAKCMKEETEVVHVEGEVEKA